MLLCAAYLKVGGTEKSCRIKIVDSSNEQAAVLCIFKLGAVCKFGWPLLELSL